MRMSWLAIMSSATRRIVRLRVREPRLLVAALLSVVLLCFVSQADAQEPASEQHHFYAKEGDFTVDGEAMLAGTVVTAWYDGVEVGSAMIDSDGNWELRVSAAEYPNACLFRFSVSGHSALKVWSMCSQRVVLEYETDDNDVSNDPDEPEAGDRPEETKDPDDEPTGDPDDSDDSDETDDREHELEEDDAAVEIVTPRAPATGGGGLLGRSRLPFGWTMLTALGLGGLLLAAVRLRR